MKYVTLSLFLISACSQAPVEVGSNVKAPDPITNESMKSDEHNFYLADAEASRQLKIASLNEEQSKDSTTKKGFKTFYEIAVCPSEPALEGSVVAKNELLLAHSKKEALDQFKQIVTRHVENSVLHICGEELYISEVAVAENEENVATNENAKSSEFQLASSSVIRCPLGYTYKDGKCQHGIFVGFSSPTQGFRVGTAGAKTSATSKSPSTGVVTSPSKVTPTPTAIPIQTAQQSGACKSGYIFHQGIGCILKNTAANQSPCQGNYTVSQNGTCIPYITGSAQTIPKCGNGTIYSGGRCVTITQPVYTPPPPSCPTGTMLKNNRCVFPSIK